METLIGSTGFVGSHLAREREFAVKVHRSDVGSIAGSSTNLLVCAGLPAQKWQANRSPSVDWANMAGLAQILASVQADRAVLISTIDVYQPAVDVDEDDAPSLEGPGAYGAHRAWFEVFFRSQFPHSLVVRLPGLFASDVRKNLVHDLMHGREDQWGQINPNSTFQFFDATRTWSVIERAWSRGIEVLNVTSEPVSAQSVADLFDVRLQAQSEAIAYNVRSIHAESLDGRNGYLYSAEAILEGIAALRTA